MSRDQRARLKRLEVPLIAARELGREIRALLDHAKAVCTDDEFAELITELPFTATTTNTRPSNLERA